MSTEVVGIIVGDRRMEKHEPITDPMNVSNLLGVRIDEQQEFAGQVLNHNAILIAFVSHQGKSVARRRQAHVRQDRQSPISLDRR